MMDSRQQIIQDCIRDLIAVRDRLIDIDDPAKTDHFYIEWVKEEVAMGIKKLRHAEVKDKYEEGEE